MRLRRLRAMTCYWHQGSFVVHAYVRGAPVSLHPGSAEILSAFETWTSPQEAADTLDHLTSGTVEKAVHTLCDVGLLVAEGSDDARQDEHVAESWSAWAPEAAFFHYGTRDAPFEPATPELRQHLTGAGRPALFTEYPRAERILLPRGPAPALRVPLETALYQRRTHRSFTDRAVSLTDLAALLALTFGPADFIDGHEYGALMRRTSPAGGSRQEIEAYLAVPNVEHVAPGLYHYNAREHSLELIAEGFTHAEAAQLCADQEGTAEAAFLIFLVAVWERMRVKYRHPRAYRVSLLNAGHLGQTFALAATALGLGPFQTAAFDDTAVETRLALDPAACSALYALAAGHPRGEDAQPAGLKPFRLSGT
ncbi:SagB/ThcOx family dehydrogenase [Streptomyces sp. NPDC058734]|uniref:SagB/ThcOx family dehydrogenase n=1 Tax=Streptomyces sp. NPDC058734 TaxID=3346615 RepID=UPI0036BA86FB